MEGYKVHFLMGNDENTIKVARRAAELGLAPKEYCDTMAKQFQEIWRALAISYDDFIQTSEPRHHLGCRKFIQKVYDNGAIYKGTYEGLYCEGCESFKTERDLDEQGRCPNHPHTPLLRRSGLGGTPASPSRTRPGSPSRSPANAAAACSSRSACG